MPFRNQTWRHWEGSVGLVTEGRGHSMGMEPAVGVRNPERRHMIFSNLNQGLGGSGASQWDTREPVTGELPTRGDTDVCTPLSPGHKEFRVYFPPKGCARCLIQCSQSDSFSPTISTWPHACVRLGKWILPPQECDPTIRRLT